MPASGIIPRAAAEIQGEKVRGHLERIGGFKDFPMETIMGMDEPYHYRNKAQFPVGKIKTERSSPVFMQEGPTLLLTTGTVFWE